MAICRHSISTGSYLAVPPIWLSLASAAREAHFNSTWYCSQYEPDYLLAKRVLCSEMWCQKIVSAVPSGADAPGLTSQQILIIFFMLKGASNLASVVTLSPESWLLLGGAVLGKCLGIMSWLEYLTTRTISIFFNDSLSDWRSIFFGFQFFFKN